MNPAISKSISDYAMIGNCQSAALVARDGSVDWWCAPRFDSPAIFARILDRDAGHWSITPAGPFEVTRKYVDRSMVLETTMRTPTGTIVLTDALALGPNERGHDIGLASPAALLRTVRCVSGTVEIAVEIALRPEFGLVTPIVERCDGGAFVRGGAEHFVLSIHERPVEISEGTIRSHFALGEGDRCCLALERMSSRAAGGKPWRERDIAARIDAAVEGWQTWAAMHQLYEGAYADLVHHSGRVLQALTYQPTGSIVAAPTTSLPESPGGALNWDYRFAWIRDASFTMDALWIAACPDEAHRLFDSMSDSAAGEVRKRDLRVVFGVRGEHDLSERELPHLRGWRDSRPVRVGNDAWRQRQLDVYGEVAGAALLFLDQLDSFDPISRTFIIDAVDRAAELWDQPDQGIWEVRGAAQHFVHSKLMCWQALVAGIAMADRLGVRDRVADWARRRDEIDAAIRARAWCERKQSYTQSFGSEKLDASTLHMLISGFLQPDDPRARSTVRAIVSELAEGNLVRRYTGDGDDTTDGAFVMCSFWLAHALALLGDVDEARDTFERTARCANDVSLLAEQIDIVSKEQLGNFPLALSHVGLVNAAAAIDAASKRRSAVPASGGRLSA